MKAIIGGEAMTFTINRGKIVASVEDKKGFISENVTLNKLLLLAGLEKLEEIRCGIIDVEVELERMNAHNGVK